MNRKHWLILLGTLLLLVALTAAFFLPRLPSLVTPSSTLSPSLLISPSLSVPVTLSPTASATLAFSPTPTSLTLLPLSTIIVPPTYTPFPPATPVPIPPDIHHSSPFASENVKIVEVIDLQAQLLANPARMPVDEGTLVRDIGFDGWSSDGQHMILSAWMGEQLITRRKESGCEGGCRSIHGIRHLWVAEVDGNQVWEIAHNGARARWSPDGQYVAYVKMVATEEEEYGLELWVVNTNGSEPRRLSQEGQYRFDETAWLDSHTLIFVAGEQWNELWCMQTDGTQIHITIQGVDVGDYRISAVELAPDHRTIAIQIEGSVWIGTLSGDYKQARFLTQIETPDFAFFSWSPGSDMLAIYPFSDPYRPFDHPLRVMRTDASEVFQVSWPNHNQSPIWSPDGHALVFAPRGPHLYIVNADGTGARPLDETPLEADWPFWSPDGRFIGFNAQDSYTGAALLRLQLVP